MEEITCLEEKSILITQAQHEILQSRCTLRSICRRTSLRVYEFRNCFAISCWTGRKYAPMARIHSKSLENTILKAIVCNTDTEELTRLLNFRSYGGSMEKGRIDEEVPRHRKNTDLHLRVKLLLTERAGLMIKTSSVAVDTLKLVELVVRICLQICLIIAVVCKYI
jgi:hypothetical protein